ncbi:response regulator [bacterium]|nr:response regulator [bacterium]
MFTDSAQPKSFRHRVLTFWVPVVVVETILAVFLADFVARRGLEEQIRESLLEDATLRSLTVTRALDDIEVSSRRLAIHPGIRRSLKDRDRLTAFLLLSESAKSFPIGSRLLVTDLRGSRLAEAARASVATARAGAVTFEGVPLIRQEQTFVRDRGIVHVLPILSGAELIGNLTVEVPWSHIGVGLNQGGPRDYLLAADGSVRIASRKRHAEEWKSAARESPIFRLGDDIAVRHAFRSGDVVFELLSVALVSEVEGPLAALRRQLSVAFVLLGLLVLAVTVYLTRLISRPIAEIDRQVRHMAHSGKDAGSVMEEGTAETASLARSFNDFITQIRQTKENEARLLQQLALREKMAGLGTLAGGVAHEFNNALGGIVSNVESALHEVTSPSVREDLELVRKVALRASAIAKNLLGFARQTPAGEKTAGNIVEVLEDTLNVVKQIFAADGMHIKRELESVPFLLFDRGQMQQVFLNLLTNARQAMRRGDTLTVRIRESGVLPKSGPAPWYAAVPQQKPLGARRSVEISFVDTGFGIPEENLSKIFEPFFTTKGALGGAETPGTGLGLSVSHTILQNHGGDITVSSKPGKGTTVTVFLPVDEEAARGVEEKPAPARPPRRSTDSLRILVVDDEDAIRTSLVKTLRRMRHEVDAAPNGHAAAQMVRTENYDLLFMDLLMPDMDGFSVFDQIKLDRPASMPLIVFMTGAPTPENLERASGMGALGIMEKPFLVESVAAFIDRALAANV